VANESQEVPRPNREVSGEQATTGGGSRFGEVRKGLDVVVTTTPDTTQQPLQSASGGESPDTPANFED
jgi:hypothetical protein